MRDDDSRRFECADFFTVPEVAKPPRVNEKTIYTLESALPIFRHFVNEFLETYALTNKKPRERRGSARSRAYVWNPSSAGFDSTTLAHRNG